MSANIDNCLSIPVSVEARTATSGRLRTSKKKTCFDEALSPFVDIVRTILHSSVSFKMKVKSDRDDHRLKIYRRIMFIPHHDSSMFTMRSLGNLQVALCGCCFLCPCPCRLPNQNFGHRDISSRFLLSWFHASQRMSVADRWRAAL